MHGTQPIDFWSIMSGGASHLIAREGETARPNSLQDYLLRSYWTIGMVSFQGIDFNLLLESTS